MNVQQTASIPFAHDLRFGRWRWRNIRSPYLVNWRSHQCREPPVRNLSGPKRLQVGNGQSAIPNTIPVFGQETDMIESRGFGPFILFNPDGAIHGQLSCINCHFSHFCQIGTKTSRSPLLNPKSLAQFSQFYPCIVERPFCIASLGESRVDTVRCGRDMESFDIRSNVEQLPQARQDHPELSSASPYPSERPECISVEPVGFFFSQLSSQHSSLAPVCLWCLCRRKNRLYLTAFDFLCQLL